MEELRLGIKGRVGRIFVDRDISWNWIQHDEPMVDAFIRHSVLNDVIVLSLPGPHASSHATAFVAAVASGARTPVLAVPDAGPTLNVSGKAAVAWDGSGEAAIATRAALPLLQRASSVHLIEVAEYSARSGATEGAVYLCRHGVTADTVRRLSRQGHVGAAIIEAARALDAGLIVIGANGHARVTDFLLGSVTRTMLTDSPVSLLIAH